MNDIKKIEIPELCLVLLIGVSGSGKSFFANTHFSSSEIVSIQACRAQICDDENSPLHDEEALDLAYFTVQKRLELSKLSVLDADFIQVNSRLRALKLAKEQHIPLVAIVLDTPLKASIGRKKTSHQGTQEELLKDQYQQFRRTVKLLQREGIKQIHTISGLETARLINIQRNPMPANRKDQSGPFDLIGDVHGCCDELEKLLLKLGYTKESPLLYSPPPGRKAFFLGDLIDRGPRNIDALNLGINMVNAGYAEMVLGNHEAKFIRFLQGKKVQQKFGLEKTVREFESLLKTLPEHEAIKAKDKYLQFLLSLGTHYILDQGKLVVAHAGMKSIYQGRSSGKIDAFALYGETNGESDDFGLPIRFNWALDYQGLALVVYGHVPVPEAEFVNNTIDIDTGCVFGGKLTALRYPELQIIQEKAQEQYYDSHVRN